jgi:LacI family transcriptional regulator
VYSTIKDVAKLSKTSVATVSRYLNNRPIRLDNKTRIEDAIKQLDYSINVAAQNLKTNRTMSIGIVIPDLIHNFDINLVKGIQNKIRKSSYHTFIMDTENNIQFEKDALEFLYSKKVDGIILDPISNNEETLQQFVDAGTPIVLIDQKLNNVQAPAVVSDNVNAVYNCVEHLLTMGHKKIGIILGPQDLFTAEERYRGYKRAFEDYHIPMNENFVKHGNYTSEGGYKCMLELLEMHERPTAVIVSNYDMTKGALIGINEKEVTIPEDISFIGYDFYDLTEIYKPRLSMVIQSNIEMGELAAALLIKLMDGESVEHDVYRLKTNFISGDSIKKL